MDQLSDLQALGLELPSPAYLIGAVLFGILGLAAYRYGRRHDRRWTRWLAIVLMFYPYAVSNTALLYGIGGLLCLGIYLDRA